MPKKLANKANANKLKKAKQCQKAIKINTKVFKSIFKRM